MAGVFLICSLTALFEEEEEEALCVFFLGAMMIEMSENVKDDCDVESG